MKTEILKLDRPYEYIYCNGSIGLHIATMIVYEAKTDEDGEYELETHSHPVVKYRGRPGGTVWNKAELTDCSVLCSEDDKRISMHEFYNFVSGIGRMRLSERGEEQLRVSITAQGYGIDHNIILHAYICCRWYRVASHAICQKNNYLTSRIIAEHPD